jgi:MFS transporter, UMF1 family
MIVAQSEHKPSRLAIGSWMLFDWAAQPFFTVIITFIFGPYFVSRLADNSVIGQTVWGYTIAAAGIVIALMSPLLGVVADATGARKPWIVFFAAIKMIALILLWFAAPGSNLLLPSICIVIATVAAECSILFNDSMMPRLMNQSEMGKISNIAWGLGYVGGLVVLFSVILLLAANSATGKTLLGIVPLFGLDAAQGEDARVTGPIAASWYFLFILPMLFFTPDAKQGVALRSAIANSISQLGLTLKEVKNNSFIVQFLVARMLYQDGVNGLLALGGTFAAAMFGWQTLEMGIYGILLLVVAIVGCGLAAYVDRWLGSKKLILLSLSCLIIAAIGIVATGQGYTLFGFIKLPTEDAGGLFATSAEKIYIGFGLLIGIAFGPVQASSRSYLARSVSAEESGRYFGLYALSGRVTAFLAPMTVASVTLYSGSAALGMAMLVIFLLVGFILLAKIKVD